MAIERLRAPENFKTRSTGTSKSIVGVLALLLLSLLTLPFFQDSRALDAPGASAGTIDYRGWGALDRPVALTGNWRFRWQAPAGVAAPPLMAVPGRWDAGNALPESGRATYSMIVRGLKPGRYALHVAPIFGASRVFVDGRPVSLRGRIGNDAATTHYVVRAHAVHFETRGAPVAIAIEIATFRHRDNGLLTAPLLGSAAAMENWTAARWAQELMFFSALVLLGLYSLVVFLYRRDDRASLFYALAAFLFIPFSAEEGFDNLLPLLAPDLGFPATLALLNIGTQLAMGAFVAYSRHLFPQETPQWSYRGFIAFMVMMITAVVIGFVLGGTLLASRINPVFPVFMFAMFAHLMVVLGRAVQRKREGALVFLLGVGLFLIINLAYGLSVYGVVPRDLYGGFDLLSFSALLLLFSHIIIMAERWSAAITASQRLNDDLRQLLDVNLAITSEIQLEALLAKIVSVTTKVLRAERSTLLIHDAAANELQAIAAEGISAQQFRIAVDEGLAGQAFTTGATINVEDVYKDSRFNDRMDTQTGYRTRNLLSMPIVTRDGRCIGVMQALNRLQPGPFDNDDIERMRAFAAQAAVAIDNAGLFKEVVTSRNYNESILRSMSSGVITLDSHGSIVKRNLAANTILSIDEGDDNLVAIQAYLYENNDWMGAEIAAVRDSGEAKTLLDTDIATAGGQKSANISIVPLNDSAGDQGFLILIEDISQGKRLEGAMRRFMTQKIVDQVLARGDELMFGSACRASVLFADIRNFTGMAESLGPRQTVDMLNSVFTDLYDAVSDADGVLDKFIGDAVMAVYGAPLPGPDDAGNAVNSAIRMQAMIVAINARRAQDDLPPLGLGIGIATGEVVAGTIGSPKRMDYTVIGDSVNLAARLQALTKTYGVNIIICEDTAAANPHLPKREIDVIRARGRQRPARIFEVLPPGPAPAWHGIFNAGRDALAAGDWAAAVAAFDAVLAVAPDDRTAALMHRRAASARITPPPASWNGVWDATTLM